MNARTTMSEKGQIVIPKDVRTRLHMRPGDRLDIIERPDGVLLRKERAVSSESFDDITARIRARCHYDGPAVPIDDMRAAINSMWREGGPRWDG